MLGGSASHLTDTPLWNLGHATTQDEIKAKNKKLALAKQKLSESKQEIEDLQKEFETEREDLLSTIRNSDQEMKFYKKYLEKVLPLLRRDCNFYNFDKIKKQSEWDENTSEWLMPSVNVAPASESEDRRSRDRDARHASPVLSESNTGLRYVGVVACASVNVGCSSPITLFPLQLQRQRVLPAHKPQQGHDWRAPCARGRGCPPDGVAPPVLQGFAYGL